MSLLVVDVGNSSVRAAVYRGDAREHPRAVLAAAATARPLTAVLTRETPRDRRQIDALVEKLVAVAGGLAVARTVVVSVVPAVGERICATLPRVVRADHTSDLPFSVAVSAPAAVGADRYCNVAAAVEGGLRDGLIVDAGTATTFDLLVAGTFVGGLIAPGIGFAARKLGENAARLRPVEIVPVDLAPGRDTDAAMQAGAYHVGRFGVLGTIDALRERYGEIPVVLTGGLGGLLDEPRWIYDADWTLRGAALLAIR